MWLSWERRICVGFCDPTPRYYNAIRTHRSLDKDAPAPRAVQRIENIESHAILGGLHHHYVRV